MIDSTLREGPQDPVSKRFQHLSMGLFAFCFALGSSGVLMGQITEATTKPPQETKSRLPQGPNPKVKPDAPGETAPMGNENELVARIISLEDQRLTVADKDQDKQITVNVSPKAQVTLNRQPAKLADLKPNDFVRLTLDRQTPKSGPTATVVAAARVVRDTPPSEVPMKAPRRPEPEPVNRAPLAPANQGGGLGVVVSDSPEQGILILHVHRDTPAWKAGIQAGDYLLKVDEKPIATPEEFLTLIQQNAPNEMVRLQLWREGKMRTGAVQLTTREAARDREAAAGQALILGETKGEDTVVIDREPARSTVVIDREPAQAPVVVEKRQETRLPEDYKSLAEKHQELQRRFELLELQLNQLRLEQKQEELEKPQQP